MRRFSIFFILLAFVVLSSSPAFSLSITTSASGTNFLDSYSYVFTIDNGDSDDGIYSATLTNTSDTSLNDALIDLLAFNMGAELGTDFTIGNVVPDWTFEAGSGGIQFDYVGNADSPSDKIAPGEVLTFDFIFNSAFDDSFDVWTSTSPSLGTGIGGGEDFGQVAVSFQQLGRDGEGSDLLASNWNAAPVPEPATMLLLGTGLVGLAGFSRKKIKK